MISGIFFLDEGSLCMTVLVAKASDYRDSYEGPLCMTATGWGYKGLGFGDNFPPARWVPNRVS